MPDRPDPELPAVTVLMPEPDAIVSLPVRRVRELSIDWRRREEDVVQSGRSVPVCAVVVVKDVVCEAGVGGAGGVVAGGVVGAVEVDVGAAACR
jgi:hypothetical protein